MTPRHQRLAVAMLATLLVVPPLDTRGAGPGVGAGPGRRAACPWPSRTWRSRSTWPARSRWRPAIIDTNVVLADVTFGLTNKIAVDVAVPLVTSKYSGPFQHPGTNIDDGTYRTSFSDVRFAVRYNLVRDGAVITPYIGSVVPSNNYAYYGHAAPGQQLNELQVGVYAAKLLERGLPGPVRLGPLRVRVRGEGGRHLPQSEPGRPRGRLLLQLQVPRVHDGQRRIDARRHRLAGSTGLPGLPRRVPAQPRPDPARAPPRRGWRSGVLDRPTRSTCSGRFRSQVAGRNGHALDRGITVGAELGVPAQDDPGGDGCGDRSVERRVPTAETEKREGTLLRCICQKS